MPRGRWQTFCSPTVYSARKLHQLSALTCYNTILFKDLERPNWANQCKSCKEFQSKGEGVASSNCMFSHWSRHLQDCRRLQHSSSPEGTPNHTIPKRPFSRNCDRCQEPVKQVGPRVDKEQHWRRFEDPHSSAKCKFGCCKM